MNHESTDELIAYLRRKMPGKWAATPQADARRILDWYRERDLFRCVRCTRTGALTGLVFCRRVTDARQGAGEPYAHAEDAPLLWVDWVAADDLGELRALTGGLPARWADRPRAIHGVKARHGDIPRALPTDPFLRHLAG